MKGSGKATLLWLGIGSALAGPVVLNFDALALSDYGVVPGNYGTSLSPNLAGVSYRTFTFATDTTYLNSVEFWNADYGDLTKVAFAAASPYAAEVSLVPAAGYGIRVISFDMAGWPATDRPNAIMRFVDGSGNVLLDYAASGPVSIEGDFIGARHSTFAPNLAFAGTIRFE